MANTIRSIRKQCRICGVDCAGKPRVKDQYGHYYCQECARAHMRPGAPPIEGTQLQSSQIIAHEDLHSDVISAIKAEEAQAARIQAEQAQVEEEAQEAEPVEPEEVDEDIIPLAPEDQTEDQRLRSCPVCFHKYPPEAGVCANCGFDETIGIQSSRFVEKSRTSSGHAHAHHGEHRSEFACLNCGYDMSAATSLICPECGTHMPTRKRPSREELSRQTDREAYRRPAIQLAIGLGIMILVGLFTIGPRALVIDPLTLALQSAVGLGVFYLCCLGWIGFDAPLKLNALNLLAIYAVVGATAEIFDLLPIPVIGGVVSMLVFISLFMQQMEVELADAIIVLVLTVLFWVAITVFVLPMLFSAIGLA